MENINRMNCEATAQAVVTMNPSTIELITSGSMPKGDVFTCARHAGIQAAKKAHELIPLSSPMPTDGVKVALVIKSNNQVEILSSVRYHLDSSKAQIEALTAASVTALTVYDMCQNVDKDMVVGGITIVDK